MLSPYHSKPEQLSGEVGTISNAEVVGIAVALGIDCLAVSAGIALTNPPFHIIVVSSLLFGLFQFAMAFGGMYGGVSLGGYLSSYVRLVGAFVLATIGLIMMRRGRILGEFNFGLLTIAALIGASFSVSIDALGAGIALGLVGGTSLGAAIVIGCISTGMSVAGFTTGRIIARSVDVAERIGGVVLIFIAFLMVVLEV